MQNFVVFRFESTRWKRTLWDLTKLRIYILLNVLLPTNSLIHNLSLWPQLKLPSKWHHQLRHLHQNALHDMSSKSNMVLDLPSNISELPLCESCIVDNHHKKIICKMNIYTSFNNFRINTYGSLWPYANYIHQRLYLYMYIYTF